MKLVKCRWKYSVYGDRKNVGYDGADWINMAEDRDRWRTVLNTVHRPGVP
jgi:hypothetical protein